MTRSRSGRPRIEAVEEGLEREYGDVTVVEKTWHVDPEAYDRHRDRIEAGTDGGAGIWLTNDDGEVLLVRNEGDDGWGDPGGKIEGDESFEVGAKRETREEAGVEAEITGLCEVHLIEMRDETDPDRRRTTSDEAEATGPDRPGLVTPIVVFEGDHVGGEPRPREGEIAAVDWFAAPPETVLYEEVATRPYPATE